MLKYIAVRLASALPEEKLARAVELHHLRNLLRILRIDCALDVGANKGQFAHELRTIGYRGRIVSFEPQQREFATMRERFRHDVLWSGHQIALGSKNGTASLNVASDLTVLSSFHQLALQRKNMATETVEIRKLDDMPGIINAGERVFLKMDTQGYDLEVFKGATNTLRQVFGLQSEISVNPIYNGVPRYLEALGLYESAGFRLYDLSLVSRHADGSLTEMNCFMRR